jgi:hypothetical protein
MNWLERGNRWLSSGYHIHRCTRGFELWWKTKDRYVILARELPSLPAAKEFAEKHKGRVSLTAT